MTGDVTQHYDGASWTVVPTVDLFLTSLKGVSAVAPDDVWVVGYAQRGGAYRTMIQHWDGTQFSVVPSPTLGKTFNILNDVEAVSANDVWAVGQGATSLVEHWDGTSWTIVPVPGSARLESVSAGSSSDVWAVGGRESSTDRPALLHWNGGWWTSLDSPVDGSLFGVAAIAANDVWAVGSDKDSKPLVEHWDGIQWSQVFVPGLSRGHLSAVSGTTSADVWAVGDTSKDGVPVALHWDGSTWNSVPVPDSAENVAAISQWDAWAVGRYDSVSHLDNVQRFCPAAVGDAGFDPATLQITPGGTVVWAFDRAAQEEHSVTDATGIGLFDSGLQHPGALYSYLFDAAATYPVVDVATGATSLVEVPVFVAPKQATSAGQFNVAWALHHAPSGLVYDVQVLRPGGEWEDWLVGTGTRKSTFLPDAGGGLYSFRARVRDETSGSATGYSPPTTVRVKSLTADVSITGSDAPDPVPVEGQLTYSFVVTNAGPKAAGNVVVTDQLPASATFVSATATTGSCTGGVTVTCALGSIGVGITEIVTIVVTPGQIGPLANTATVTTGSRDPDLSDNATTVSTTVTP
jgi:uncharacterized repeat protein (TIGR01451 family)